MNKSWYRSKASHKVFIMALVSLLILTAVYLACYKKQRQLYENGGSEDYGRTILLALNEIDKLVEKAGNEEALLLARENIGLLAEDVRMGQNDHAKSGLVFMTVLYAGCVLVLVSVYVVIYILILRPFDRLEDFASEIAEGKLDGELKVKRVNMFGEFTWAFDHMRKEIGRARQCEQEAIENNKTVIATLSHDIKTPIASIRGYAEALSCHMDSTQERRDRYLSVIMKKCDEVTKITDDMFIHSLHDLDRLIIRQEDVQIDAVIRETVYSMQGGRDDIHIKGSLHAEIVSDADAGRIAQVIENIISNARKYAPASPIDVWTERDDNEYRLYIRDYGPGIPSEDMPFIFEKFYRGKNRGAVQGSGLGLFIVKYVMEQMGGAVRLKNQGGLICILSFMIS